MSEKPDVIAIADMITDRIMNLTPHPPVPKIEVAVPRAAWNQLAKQLAEHFGDQLLRDATSVDGDTFWYGAVAFRAHDDDQPRRSAIVI